MAAHNVNYRASITVLCILTTIFLQVLSNLANDFGDHVHGADHDGRQGPSRAVQSGKITPQAMKRAILIFVILSFSSGCSLLWVAFGTEMIREILLFLGLGILSIVAAIKYTAGKKPYGYVGLGDVSVFLFFGIVGVLGTYFVHVRSLDLLLLLPATSCGLFATVVLNINNIRDIDSDKDAGKKSIPVRIGKKNARVYNWVLILIGLASTIAFVIIRFQSWWQLLFLISAVPILLVGKSVWENYDPEKIDPLLKKMALSTLLFVITFGIGSLLAAVS